MSEIKYLHLLDGIVGESDIELMEMAATEHRKYSNITFKIAEVDDKKVIIGISQGRSNAENHQTQKRLIDIVHETFDRFFPGRKILVHANPYKEPDCSQVDGDWITKRMNKHQVKLKTIAADTGLNYTFLSSMLNGNEAISQLMKAMLWYYFKVKENGIKGKSYEQ
jgi:5-carboxymethyl-2-hydroxymuconate isomerase